MSDVLTFDFFVVPLSQVKLIKDDFGYDDAFNYKKETDLDAALSK